MQVAFFMLNNDLSVHESFAYINDAGTASLTGPVTSTFANANCEQCSFASATATSSTTPYLYYLRIADLRQKHWDFSSSGEYSFKVTSITPGCPSACSNVPGGVCGCYCTSTQSCPAPVQ